MRETYTDYRAIRKFELGCCPACGTGLIVGRCPLCKEEWTKEKVWQGFHSEKEIPLEELEKYLGITPEKKRLAEESLNITPKKKRLVGDKADLLIQLNAPLSFEELLRVMLLDYQKSEEELSGEILVLKKIFGLKADFVGFSLLGGLTFDKRNVKISRYSEKPRRRNWRRD